MPCTRKSSPATSSSAPNDLDRERERARERERERKRDSSSHIDRLIRSHLVLEIISVDRLRAMGVWTESSIRLLSKRSRLCIGMVGHPGRGFATSRGIINHVFDAFDVHHLLTLCTLPHCTLECTLENTPRELDMSSTEERV